MQIVYANVSEIITEGTYNMGDGETPEVAEERALVQAKRVAVESAGTYLESYSKVMGLQLIQDEIRIISSGIMKVEVLEKNRIVQDKGAIQFWVRIKAIISTDNVADMASRLRERSITNKYKEVQQRYIDLQTDHLAALTSKQAQKAAINEKLWLSNRWLDIGTRQYLLKEYENAVASLTKSYNLNNNSKTAAILAGDIFFERQQYDSAIKWYEMAGKSEEAYWKTALAYEAQGRLLMAKLNYERIVGTLLSSNLHIDMGALNVKNENAWFRLGLVTEKQAEEHKRLFSNDRYYGEAILCYGKAIALSPHYESAYYRRGLIYEKINKPYEAAQDYKRFLAIGNKDHEAYGEAQQRLQGLKSEYGIM